MKPSLSKHISNLIIGLCFCQILLAKTNSLDSIFAYFDKPGESISIIIPAEPDSITADSKMVLGPSNQILSASALYRTTDGMFGVTLTLIERIKQIEPVQYDIVDVIGERIASGALILKGKTAEVDTIIIENGSEDRITLSEGKTTYSAIIIIGRYFYLNTEIEFDNPMINVVGSPSVLFASDSDITQIDTLSFAIVIHHESDEKKETAIGNQDFSIKNLYATDTRAYIKIEEFQAKSNYVQVSAIKSVSGITPPSEFIDAQFRFKLGKHLANMVSLDIPLSAAGDTSTIEERTILNEATLYLAWDISSTCSWSHARNSMRSLQLGIIGKLFDGDVYSGIGLSGVELKNSLLYGSYILGCFVWDVNEGFQGFGPDLYLELRIYSGEADFFRTFALKLGVFISKPFSKQETSMKSRIVLEIPIGKIRSF